MRWVALGIWAGAMLACAAVAAWGPGGVLAAIGSAAVLTTVTLAAMALAEGATTGLSGLMVPDRERYLALPPAGRVPVERLVRADFYAFVAAVLFGCTADLLLRQFVVDSVVPLGLFLAALPLPAGISPARIGAEVDRRLAAHLPCGDPDPGPRQGDACGREPS